MVDENQDWEPYDPAWLVNLACNQIPDEPWLAAALEDCRIAWRQSPAYTCFVDPTNPNEPGSKWQFETNITLEDPSEGTLVLDILKNKRIGGYETLSKIEV